MEIAPAAAVVGGVVAWQFAGRFVPARRSLLLPLVLVAVGVGQAGHVRSTAIAVAVVGADVLLTAGLGALPFLDTSAGPALEATLAASFGVSLAVQFAVFNARVARDGRPIRPARRRTDTRATLAR